MFKPYDRVRHKDKEIDKEKGVFTILEIKGGTALCSYHGDFNRAHIRPWNYPIVDLIKAE